MTDADRHLTDITTAAARLGISTDALRKRLERGKGGHQGKKIEGRWFVWLPGEPSSQIVAQTEAPAPPPAVRPVGQPSDRDRQLTDTVAELREEVRWLRARVEASEERERELRRLWLASVPALASPEPPRHSARPARQEPRSAASGVWQGVVAWLRRQAPQRR